MAKANFKIEVEANNRIMGAAMLAAGAFWTLGATVAEEAKAKAPVVKAAVKDYAQMGMEAADEKTASILTSFAAKLQNVAENMKANKQ